MNIEKLSIPLQVDPEKLRDAVQETASITVTIDLEKLRLLELKVRDLVRAFLVLPKLESLCASCKKKLGEYEYLHVVCIKKGLPGSNITITEEVVGSYTTASTILLLINDTYRAHVIVSHALSPTTSRHRYLEEFSRDQIEDINIVQKTILETIAETELKILLGVEEFVEKEGSGECPTCKELGLKL